MTVISDAPVFAEPPPGMSAYDRKLFHRGHHAINCRRAKQGKPGAAEAVDHHRREMAAAQVEQYITDTLAKAPPLTNDQRAKLAELLRPLRS